MKGGKSGSGKYYYFLLPDNRSVQVGAQYSPKCEILSSLFFGYLYKNGREGASCGEKWLLNRILHTVGICKCLIYGIIHLICSIIKFLVLLAVKELL